MASGAGRRAQTLSGPGGDIGDRDEFLSQLGRFLEQRGFGYTRNPTILGRDVDLFELYKTVNLLGGWEKVGLDDRWEDLAEDFGYPRACVNASQALKTIYVRYLCLFEKKQRGGEVSAEYEDEVQSTPGRKRAKDPMALVPMAYKHQQHEVSSHIRKQLNMCQNFVMPTEYDKIEKSLLCGLPNEVDFAFNVCTLLSNEGRHKMQLNKKPLILDLMLAHIGLYREGASHLFTLATKDWKNSSKHNFLRFWLDSVRVKEIRDLLSPESLYTKEEVHVSDFTCQGDLGNQLLNLGQSLGLEDGEGQRILQVLMILRNMSFEEENMVTLASDVLVYRFLLLCLHSEYSTLSQLALDTLGNICLKMVLDPIEYRTTQFMMATLVHCITSADRFHVVRGLEMLSKLCQVEVNCAVVEENLDIEIYKSIISYLTVHDIQLIVFTLEALYQLSKLGSITTDQIVGIHSAIASLVSLTTIEAQSYGPDSLQGIKVVEHIPAGVPMPTPTVTPTPITSTPNQHHHQQRTGTPLQAGAPVQPQTPQVQVIQRQTIPGAQLIGSPQVQTNVPRSGVPVMVTNQTYVALPGHQQNVQVGTSSLPVQPGIILPSGQTGNQAALQMPPPPPARTSGSGAVPFVAKSDAEKLAVAWMVANFEYGKGVFSKGDLYKDYLMVCNALNITNQVNSQIFGNCIRLAYSSLNVSFGRGLTGQDDIQYHGIVKRYKPLHWPPGNLTWHDSGADKKTTLTNIFQPTPSTGSKTGVSPRTLSALQHQLNSPVVSKPDRTVLPIVGQPPVLHPVEAVSQASDSPVSEDSQVTGSTVVKSLLARKLAMKQDVNDTRLASEPPTSVSGNEKMEVDDKLALTSSVATRPTESSVNALLSCASTIVPSAPTANKPSCDTSKPESNSRLVENNPMNSNENTKSSLHDSSNALHNHEPVPKTQINGDCNSAPKINGKESHSENQRVPLVNGLPEETDSKLMTLEEIKKQKLSKMIDENNYFAKEKNSPLLNGFLSRMGNGDHIGKKLSVCPVTDSRGSSISKDKKIVENGYLSGESKDKGILEKHEVESAILLRDSEQLASPKCPMMDPRDDIRTMPSTQEGTDTDGLSPEKPEKERNCGHKESHQNSLNSISQAEEQSHVEPNDSETLTNSSCDTLLTSQKGFEKVGDMSGKDSFTPKDLVSLTSNQMDGAGDAYSTAPSNFPINETLSVGKDASSVPPVSEGQSEIQQCSPTLQGKLTGPAVTENMLSSVTSAASHTQASPVITAALLSPIKAQTQVAFSSSTSIAQQAPAIASALQLQSQISPSSAADQVSLSSPASRKRKSDLPNVGKKKTKKPNISYGPNDLVCEWTGCNECFRNSEEASHHVLSEHYRKDIQYGICQWTGCDQLRRAKWSLFTHIKDKHLTEAAWQASIKRRQDEVSNPQESRSSINTKSASSTAETTPTTFAPQIGGLQSPAAQPASTQLTAAQPGGAQVSTPQTAVPVGAAPGQAGAVSAPVYPVDAAVQAIRRHAPRPPYPELLEMKEGPVTKHIRLTSALILRNISRYSAHGRSLIKQHEHKLAYVAMSAGEASPALASCLYELKHPNTQQH